MTRGIFLSFALCFFGWVQIYAQQNIPKHALSLHVSAQSKGITLAYEYSKPVSSLFAVSGRGYLGYGYSGQLNNAGGDIQMSNYYTGTAYAIGGKDRLIQHVSPLNQMTVGAEAAVLVGKNKHYFEGALAWGIDIYSKGVNYIAHKNELGSTPNIDDLSSKKPTRVGDHLSCRVGYRYFSNGKLNLGAGVALHMLQGFISYYYATPATWTPYVSIGYNL